MIIISKPTIAPPNPAWTAGKDMRIATKRKCPRCRGTYDSWFSSVAIERSEIDVRVAESEEAEGWDGVAGWGEELSVRAFLHPNLSDIEREFDDTGTTSTRKSAKLKMRG